MAEADEQPAVRLVVHCRRCRGWLMSPESVAQRIGPTWGPGSNGGKSNEVAGCHG
jgi:hypothetical protein